MSGPGKAMSPAAFDRLLDTHGADPARWPAADRAAAMALAAASPAAAARLDEARRLGETLDRLPAAEPSPALQARILADSERWITPAGAPRSMPPRRRSRRYGLLGGIGATLWPGWPAWQPSAVLAASLAAGLALGLAEPGLVGLGGAAATADPSALVFGETPLEEGWP